MTEDGKRFPNRDLLVCVIVLVFSFTLAVMISDFIFHIGPPDITAIMGGDFVFIGLMMAFLVYKQRFQDERSIQILDKSGRNGFVSMLYLLPLFLVVSSAFNYHVDVALTLIEFCGCSIVVVILSAIYYYRK